MTTALDTNPLDSRGVTTRPMAGGRTLTPRETQQVKAALERLRPSFATQKDLARALGMSQQVISHVLSGNPAGLALARRLADYQGVALDDMLGGGEAAESQAIRGRPGFAEALDAAQRRWPALSSALAAVGEMRNAQAPDEVTPEYLYDMAALNLKYRPAAEADTAQARSEVAAERARRGK